MIDQKDLRITSRYIPTFLKIRTFNKQIIPFRLNIAQQITNQEVIRQQKSLGYVRILNLKARKLGMSTYWDARLFHKTVTKSNTESRIICHDTDSVQTLFQICRLFYDCLPPPIKPMTRYYSKKSLVFENPSDKTRNKNPGLRSAIHVSSAKSSKAGRAPLIHHIHFSEDAFYGRDSDELRDGYLNAVPDLPHTSIIRESTANGAHGAFYRDWNRAVRKETYYMPLFLPWFIDQRYQIKYQTALSNLDEDERFLKDTYNLTDGHLEWRRRTITNKCRGSVQTFKQEYPSNPDEAFLFSGSNIFPSDLLKIHAETYTKKPIHARLHYQVSSHNEIFPLERGQVPSLSVKPKPDDQDVFFLFELPQKNLQYAVGIDSSEGLPTGDHAAITVISEHGTISASFEGILAPSQLGILAVKLGLFYNNAILNPEANKHGQWVIEKIVELQYPSIYRRPDLQTKSLKKQLGWYTSDASKTVIINFLRDAFKESIIHIHDLRILHQMKHFVSNPDGSMGGDPDDLVMSTALALFPLRENLNPLFTQSQIEQALHIHKEDAEKLEKFLRGELDPEPNTLAWIDKIYEEMQEQFDEDPDQDHAFLSLAYGNRFPITLDQLEI